MAGISGTTVLLYVEDSALPGTYLKIGGQRGLSIERTANFVEGNSKDQADEEGEPGRRASTVTFDALFLAADVGYQELVTAYEAGTKVLVQEQIGGSATFDAQGVITRLSREHPDDETSTINCEVRTSGGWVASP